MNSYFPLPEAKSKLNQRVKVILSLVDINVGDTGVVTSYYKMGKDYGVTVTWDHMNVTDGFSKSDYERFLEEV